MATDDFFEEQSEQSHVKTTLVTKYFGAWATIMMAQRHTDKIAYIDLFAGPGRYNDGTPSTPLIILRRAVEDTRLQQRLVIIFNDKESKHANSLQQEIDTFPDIQSLQTQPVVFNGEVDDSIAQQFEKVRLVPTLLFIDPFGYKGVSLRLIYSVVKDWGCDCILFFNYKRVNMAINNPFFKTHMIALFGEQRLEALHDEIESLRPNERELIVLEAFCEALQEECAEFVLPFRFRNENGTRTQHHLIFLSKNVLGYTIMKKIMAGESSEFHQGVASFEYNPSVRDQGFLFELSRPLEGLGQILLDEFAGQTLTMQEVYYQHHVGKPFIDKNYKDVLAHLEREGRIITDPPANRRKRNSFANHVQITFPMEA